jgi:hypothetical protein
MFKKRTPIEKTEELSWCLASERDVELSISLWKEKSANEE